MELRIVSPQFEVTDAIREHVERRVQKALGHFESRIGRVRVGLCDVNGPRRGADMRCRIECDLHSLCRIEAESTDADLYVAVDRAAARIGRVAGRHLLKRRTLARNGRPVAV